MTISTEQTPADSTLKAKHRAMWALGDYATLATTVIPDLGAELVAACGIRAGESVLDVAAGAGNAALPAAASGARVVACDLTPELLAAGRRRAHELGVDVDWQEGDAEALPFPDEAFDKVISCVGVMFAPHHQVAADELIRVCRPGGTIGLMNWTPEGFVGQMLAATKPYVAAPPTGTLPPPLWGDPRHVRELFGERVADIEVEKRTVTVDCFADPAGFRDYFKSHYGPTIGAYRSIGDQPDKVAALDADLADLAKRHDRGTTHTVMDWEYLLVTARRR